MVREHIAMITFNRPKSANAMSIKLLEELNHTLQKIEQDPSIYCIILTGAENRSFCAGADLKERKQMTDDQVIATVNHIGKTVTRVEQMHSPVIAALNGAAFGGGLELALACDLRISAQHVSMGLTETSLGIIPGAGGTQRLTRLIGLGQAKRLIFTAARIEANEALHIGLVEQVVESSELLDKAIEMAEMIASNGPLAIQQAKIAIHQGYQTDLATGLTIEQLCYQKTIQTEDRLEGLQAFAEKRKPEYKGK